MSKAINLIDVLCLNKSLIILHIAVVILVEAIWKNHQPVNISVDNMAISVHNFFLRNAIFANSVPWKFIGKFKVANNKFFFVSQVTILAVILLYHTIFIYNAKSTDRSPICDEFIFIALFISFRSVYLKRNIWKRWTTLYEKTNKLMKYKLGKSLELNQKYIWIYMFYTIVFIMLRVIAYYNGLEIYKYIIDIILYSFHSMEYLSIIFLMILRKGFTTLNGCSKYLEGDDGLQLHIIANMNRDETILYKRLYKSLYQMSVCFNDLFGWILLNILVQYLIVICSSAILFVNMYQKQTWNNVVFYSCSLYFMYQSVS